MTTITLASILAANAAKVAAEQAEIDTAEKTALLHELADTTEYLDASIEFLGGLLGDLTTARDAIRNVENSPSVSNELLAELIEAGDTALDEAEADLVAAADAIQEAEAEAATAEAVTDGFKQFIFNLADGGHVGALLAPRFVGERPGELVCPRHAAE